MPSSKVRVALGNFVSENPLGESLEGFRVCNSSFDNMLGIILPVVLSVLPKEEFLTQSWRIDMSELVMGVTNE
jgi:hypothetical protein